MAKDKGARMPSGMAGLVRYDEELKNAPKMDPKLIIGVACGLVILEVILRFI